MEIKKKKGLYRLKGNRTNIIKDWRGYIDYSKFPIYDNNPVWRYKFNKIIHKNNKKYGINSYIVNSRKKMRIYKNNKIYDHRTECINSVELTIFEGQFIIALWKSSLKYRFERVFRCKCKKLFLYNWKFGFRFSHNNFLCQNCYNNNNKYKYRGYCFGYFYGIPLKQCNFDFKNNYNKIYKYRLNNNFLN